MGYVSFTVNTDALNGASEALNNACEQAEHALAIQVMKDTDPFVPMRTGSLSERTRVDDNKIVYPGPYAHYLYEGVVYVDPVTHAAGFKTKDGEWRSKKGVSKVETTRPLDIKKTSHKQATSHWFEVSKAQNIKKWEKFVAKVVTHDFEK